MRVGYARVSTTDQSAELQPDAFRRAGCEKIHTEQLRIAGIPIWAGQPPDLHWQRLRAQASVGEHDVMMASTVADNVSRPAAPSSPNPSKNPLRLRAGVRMIASAYN